MMVLSWGRQDDSDISLKKGIDPKCHLFLVSRDDVWPAELLQLFVSIFGLNQHLQFLLTHLHTLLCPFSSLKSKGKGTGYKEPDVYIINKVRMSKHFPISFEQPE